MGLGRPVLVTWKPTHAPSESGEEETPVIHLTNFTYLPFVGVALCTANYGADRR